MSRWPFAVVALLALATAACANGAGDVAVRPIGPILVGDIVVEPDPSGTSATLTVATEVPVACVVVYGETDAFGGIATDTDMQGVPTRTTTRCCSVCARTWSTATASRVPTPRATSTAATS